MSAKVGTAPSTTTITFPDGTTLALGDWVEDRLFGSCQLNNGDAGSLEIFSAGRSQQIPGGRRNQSDIDTNLPRAGSNGLQKDYRMLVYSICTRFVRACRGQTVSGDVVLADVNGAYSDPLKLRTLFNIERLVALDFKYNGKSQNMGTAFDYPQGGGAYVFAATTAFEYAQNGAPSPRDRVAMAIPIDMKEGLIFTLEIKPQAPLAIDQVPTDNGVHEFHVDMKGTLVGLVQRPVV